MKTGNIIFRNTIICILFFSAFLYLRCSDQTSPEINNQKLDEAYNVAKNINGLKSLVVSKNGIIIREAYYNNGSAFLQHDVRSVTKTIIAILTGIAIDKGFIKSVNQTLGDFLPLFIEEEIPAERAKITIRDLLTMSSGIKWNELGNVVSEYNAWVSSPNQVLYMLHNPMVSEPGKLFNYNTGAIHFLSVIISIASKMNTNDFAQKYLFDPIGIEPKSWLIDKQGFNNGGAGLSLTPYDMIKIGNLILNRGKSVDIQVVSTGWIDQLSKFQITTNNILPYLTGYGYGTWNGQAQGRDFVMAMGWGGQFILIVPSLNLVVSATCNWNGIGDQTAGIQWTNTINLIMNEILMAFN